MEQIIQRMHESDRLINQRYRPMRVLGQGGMGWTLSAEDTLLESDLIAIKMLYPHLLQDSRHLLRLKNEVLVARKLIHPNIVRTHNFMTDKELGHNIVMELINGTTLREYLAMKSARLEWEIALQAFLEILASLEHAHGLGVVHLDLKPENILRAEDGSCHLADFGLAQSFRCSDSEKGGVHGTPRYMAPEQFTGGALDNRTDIYSFGILAFEIFTGRPPFQGTTVFTLADEHLHAPMPSAIQFRPDLPAWTCSILQTCSHKEKERRFQSISEIRYFLQQHSITDIAYRCSSQSPSIISTPTPLLAVAEKWSRRRDLQVWFFLFLVCILLIFARANNSFHKNIQAFILQAEDLLAIELTPLRKIFRVSLRRKSGIIQDETMVDIEATLMLLEDNSGDRDEIQKIFLSTVSRRKNPQFLEAFLQRGINPNTTDGNGNTGLHMVVGASGAEMIPILMRYGANIEHREKYGRTPLAVAVRQRDLRTIPVLLRYGANPNAIDDSGKSIRDYAEESQDTRILNLLQNARAIQ